jgi:hypothetical protein
MLDLTLASFAYLRVPLLVAGIAFLIGCLGTMFAEGRRAALARPDDGVVFPRGAPRDGHLRSVSFLAPLADAILKSPPAN